MSKKAEENVVLRREGKCQRKKLKKNSVERGKKKK